MSRMQVGITSIGALASTTAEQIRLINSASPLTAPVLVDLFATVINTQVFLFYLHS